MYIKILWFFLAISQLTSSILGCDYKLLDLEVKSYVRNIWSSNSNPVSIEDIKDDLFFVSDEEKIDTKYKIENNFSKLCKEIKEQIKNERFLSFFENCKLIYYSLDNDLAEKYATHMLLEAVKNRFGYELDYFKKINEFHKTGRPETGRPHENKKEGLSEPFSKMSLSTDKK